MQNIVSTHLQGQITSELSHFRHFFFLNLDLQPAPSHLSPPESRSCFNSPPSYPFLSPPPLSLSPHIFHFVPAPPSPLPNNLAVQYLPPFRPPHLLPNHLIFLTPSSPPVQTFIELDSEYSEDEKREKECYKEQHCVASTKCEIHMCMSAVLVDKRH